MEKVKKVITKRKIWKKISVKNMKNLEKTRKTVGGRGRGGDDTPDAIELRHNLSSSLPP